MARIFLSAKNRFLCKLLEVIKMLCSLRSLTDQMDVKLSKTMSWLLRHGAKDAGFELQPGEHCAPRTATFRGQTSPLVSLLTGNRAPCLRSYTSTLTVMFQ